MQHTIVIQVLNNTESQMIDNNINMTKQTVFLYKFWLFLLLQSLLFALMIFKYNCIIIIKITTSFQHTAGCRSSLYLPIYFPI